MGKNSTPSSTAVDRALQILEFLDGNKHMSSISEISRRLKIPKSSTHVLIRSLERRGYLTRPPGSREYTLGLKVYGLGRGLIKNLSLPELALPHLRNLVENVRLTAHLAVLEGDQAIYIQKVDGPGLIQFDTYIGKRTNLHCTAIGKVMLAYAKPDFVREFLSKSTFARHTEHTITTPGALRRDLQSIRQKGYGVDDQEEELEVRCLAVPVLRQATECIAALGISGTTGQIRPENTGYLVTWMQKTAARMLARLSGEQS